jgi:hypothetical protein
MVASVHHAHVFHAGGIFAPTPLTTAHQHSLLVLRHLHLLVGAATQLNFLFLLQGCHHQLYIDRSRLYWTDCSVLRPCRLIHCIESSLCPARRPDLQMHSAPSAPADTRHSSYFHTATPRLRKRLLTNRRASTLFTRPRRVSANACLPIAERPLFSWHRSLVGHYRRVGSDCYYQTSRQTSLRSFVRGLFIIVPSVAAGPAGSAPAVRD